MTRTRLAAVVAVATAAASITTAALVSGLAPAAGQASGRPDFSVLAARAARTLETGFYNGAGEWHLCLPLICGTVNRDWGADSLTYALYLHWALTHDRGVRPIMRALAATAHGYTPADKGWSDVAMWDSIAASREYQVTGDSGALAKAEAAFTWVDSTRTAVFAAGACRAIDYQAPLGGADHLKTLETDSNYVKAALLLFQITHDRAYLGKAMVKYAAVRKYFLDPAVPLYTVYVFDSGSACAPLHRRFFASVNGNMIWAGDALAAITGRRAYLAQAIATARALATDLGDASGVFADLQAENDVVEPLIEAMYNLATNDHQAFARNWLLTGAAAAAAGVAGNGAYARFYDGPAPNGPVTAWQANGGFAVMAVAAALDPHRVPAGQGFWQRASFVPDAQRLAGAPVRITFTGRAIAIIGTIGEVCCQAGHAKLFIDGVQTFDRTGIWQNKSSSGRHLPGSVLFAWRWNTAGRHSIVIRPGVLNAKEGGPFFHMIGYYLVR